MRKTILILMTLALALVFGFTAATAQDAAKGKSLAKKCICHKTKGDLDGMAQETFIQKMQDYNSGKLSHTGMQNIAKKYDDEQIADLAAYYAGLK